MCGHRKLHPFRPPNILQLHCARLSPEECSLGLAPLQRHLFNSNRLRSHQLPTSDININIRNALSQTVKLQGISTHITHKAKFISKLQSTMLRKLFHPHTHQVNAGYYINRLSSRRDSIAGGSIVHRMITVHKLSKTHSDALKKVIKRGTKLHKRRKHYALCMFILLCIYTDLKSSRDYFKVLI